MGTASYDYTLVSLTSQLPKSGVQVFLEALLWNFYGGIPGSFKAFRVFESPQQPSQKIKTN